MASLLVRRLQDETKERLKERARRHGRSLEAEARAILESIAVAEPIGTDPKGFGTQMAEMFRDRGFTAEERREIDSLLSKRRRSRRTRFGRTEL